MHLFFTNVRSQVSQNDWYLLRKQTYKVAYHQCKIFHSKRCMEAHEIWHYDDKNCIQKLHGLICLFNMCHLTMHLGFASIQDKFKQVKKTFIKSKTVS